jgi:FkbM family methyltransferase
VRRIRAARLLFDLLRVSDWQCVWNFKRSEGAKHMPDGIPLRIRALAGAPIRIRPGTTDPQVVRDTFLRQYHLPPPELGRDLKLVWDLGSNIGTTIAHLCHVFPSAKVLGVELDAANARLCRLNSEPWSERCEVIEGAVWYREGEVEYGGEEWGAAIVEGGAKVAPAVTLNSLVPASGVVDYVKMDIEGAEVDVLRTNTEWASRVRAIKIELHGSYTVAACMDDLEKLGFTASQDTKHPACAIGLRPSR